MTTASTVEVSWINGDDVPHLIVSPQARFKSSPVLDSDEKYSVMLTKPGIYGYFCSLHPQMQGKIVVK